MDDIIDALSATYESMGQSVSPKALVLIADDLSCYSAEKVFMALQKCRREVKGKLSVAEIIERIEEDMRPGPNEAWNIALRSFDEQETVVWNDEIAHAWGGSIDLYQDGDKTGARMAFIESYKRITAKKRDEGREPQWSVSIGIDKQGRIDAVKHAVERGLLTKGQAQLYLPSEPIKPQKLLAAPVKTEEGKKAIQEIKKMLGAN